MGDAPNDLSAAVEALRGALGEDRVLAGAAATEEIHRRSLNPDGGIAPCYLVRPRGTRECQSAVEGLAAAGCLPDAIGGLTTFWEPHTPGASVLIDTLAMREPFRVDPAERIGYCGAGITVRELDRAARAHGLCLIAYPDSDGSQSVGSMAAVACTTGLGMGRFEPVEQISGLTVVTRDATVVRTGAAWRLGRGGATHGTPDPTGMFIGSQGELGIITEVVLKLWPAPFLAARTWQQPWSSAAELADALRHARNSLDMGCVDSFRLEAVGAGREPAGSIEWFVRCWAPDSALTADHRCALVAQGLEAREPRCWVESERARRGELPEYDERFSVPPGEHRNRTGRDGFLGIEVNVNWGDQLDASLALFADLFDALATLGPGHRRLGIYPGAHVVSIGVQAMLAGGGTRADDVREVMARYAEPLLALGAVPYRPGRVWRKSIERRQVDDAAAAIVRRAGRSGDRT